MLLPGHHAAEATMFVLILKSNLSGPCIDVWCVGGVGGFGRKLGAAFLCFGAMSKSSGQKYPQHKCKLH